MVKGSHHTQKANQKNRMAHIGRKPWNIGLSMPLKYGTPLDDLTGKKFGRLTVIKIDKRDKNRNYYWFCRCECGNEKSIKGDHLKRKLVKSCGCLREEYENLLDRKYGKLTVLKEEGKKGKYRYWLCKCDCGNYALVYGDNLKSGSTRSCGCLWQRKEIIYGKKWNESLKEYIRERDGRKCQIKNCGITELENGRHLSIHHIDFDKLNCHSNNLISLCLGCHLAKAHGKNRNYWREIFKDKMELIYDSVGNVAV